MPLRKWHTFWMPLCLIYCFIVMLFYIERKWFLMRNLATILPLKSKLSGKFQHFNTKYEVSKCWKIVEFLKFSFKIKKCKTFYEAQTAGRLKEIIQLPSTYLPPDKTLLFFWNKNFLTEIYRHLVSKCFKNVVLGRQEMVKPNRNMSETKQKDVFWKTCEVRSSFLRCVTRTYCSWVEIRKTSEVFWAKLYNKMSDLFR